MASNVKNIKAAPVTAATFPIHLENYLKTRDLVIVSRTALVQITEALGVFGVALEILGNKGLLDTDEVNSVIERAKR